VTTNDGLLDGNLEDMLLGAELGTVKVICFGLMMALP